MRLKRTQYDIVADILDNVMRGYSSKSALMKEANLSFSVLRKYIEYLKEKGLIEEKDGSYVITEKGIALLNKLEEIRKLEIKLVELINELSKEI